MKPANQGTKPVFHTVQIQGQCIPVRGLAGGSPTVEYRSPEYEFDLVGSGGIKIRCPKGSRPNEFLYFGPGQWWGMGEDK